jgi:hypothetical protein
LRLAGVSAFLDRPHGTELSIMDQIDRFASRADGNIEVYVQRMAQLNRPRPASATAVLYEGSIIFEKITTEGICADGVLECFFANHWKRRRDRRCGSKMRGKT